MARTTQTQERPAASSLVERMSGRFGIDAEKFLHILKATAFRQKQDAEVSNEQLAALLTVAEQYNLNPFTKEIYAFPDKNNGIIPVVGVDGWSRIVNSHEQYDGEEFIYSPELVTLEGTSIQGHAWIECKMYRKDRSRPTIIREYLDEVYKLPFTGTNDRGKAYVVKGPWQTHPKRLHRHKAFMQCGRIALGFTGLYDEDEAHRVIDMGNVIEVGAPQTLPALEQSKVDPIIAQLVQRSIQMNSWSAAKQYLMQNFQGREFAYASSKLQEAEVEHLQSQEPITVRTVESEPSQQHREAPESTDQPSGQVPSGFVDSFEDAGQQGRDQVNANDNLQASAGLFPQED